MLLVITDLNFLFWVSWSIMILEPVNPFHSSLLFGEENRLLNPSKSLRTSNKLGTGLI